MSPKEQTEECDGCGATIVYTWPRDLNVYEFAFFDEDNNSWEVNERTVCDACKEDVLDFIDGDFSREDAVDLPSEVASGEAIRRAARQLTSLANGLQEDLKP